MRLAVFSDIHEDVVSLSEALKLSEKKHCNEIACCGDITGFDKEHYPYSVSRDSNECIRLIKENAKYVCAGNHDLYSANTLPPGAYGFDFPENWYTMDTVERINVSKGRVWTYENDCNSSISNENLFWLKGLLNSVSIRIGAQQALLSHHILPDITGSSVWIPQNKKDYAKHLAFLQNENYSLGISGHQHIKGASIINEKIYRIKSESRLCEGIQQVVCPCIAQNKGFNGFVILDFEKWKLELVWLNNFLAYENWK